MFKRMFSRRSVMEAGERARLVHSVWLTHYLVGRSRLGSGSPGRAADGLPEIPSRRVADGGFADILATPLGRAWAEDWWNIAMEHVPDVEA